MEKPDVRKNRTTQKIIGVDPSSKQPAFCIISDKGDIINYGQMPLQPLAEWENIIKECDILVIERQFLKQWGANNSGNVKGLITLVKSVGMLEALAYLNNVKVVNVTASQWQNAMLNAGYKAKRPELKRLSKLRASEETNKTIHSNDISDAICIALYYYRFTKYKKL